MVEYAIKDEDYEQRSGPPSNAEKRPDARSMTATGRSQSPRCGGAEGKGARVDRHMGDVSERGGASTRPHGLGMLDGDLVDLSLGPLRMLDGAFGEVRTDSAMALTRFRRCSSDRKPFSGVHSDAASDWVLLDQYVGRRGDR